MLRNLDSKGQLTNTTGKTTFDMELDLKFRTKKRNGWTKGKMLGSQLGGLKPLQIDAALV